MFQGIVFDMDGVLFDTEKVARNCWHEFEEEWHVPHVDELYPQVIGLNRQDDIAFLKSQMGDEFDAENFLNACWKRLYEHLDEDGVPLKPGTREILEYLHEKQIPIAICSGSSSATVRHHLESTGLTDFFQVIVGGEMIPHGKPLPDCYLIACELLGVAPEKCMGIEDSPNGIRASHAAGLYTVMVPDLVAPTEELKHLSNRVEESLLTLLKFMKSN